MMIQESRVLALSRVEIETRYQILGMASHHGTDNVVPGLSATPPHFSLVACRRGRKRDEGSIVEQNISAASRGV